MIKLELKKILRSVVGAHEKESFNDAIKRRKLNLLSKLPHDTYDTNNLKNSLKSLGLKSGDCIMIHASWRSFIGYTDSPKDVIDLFIDIVGENGTVLMPANADNKSLIFDVLNSPNTSGVLSKTFCEMKSVIRSCGAHFSVAGTGKLASDILSSHECSSYGFDDFSPYGIFSQVKNSKVIFLGLGKKPTKISLFHRVGFINKSDEYFRNRFVKGIDKTIIDHNGVEKNIHVINRIGLKNSDKNIIRIFNKIPEENRKHTKVGHLDIVVMDTHESLITAMNCASKGLYMYSIKKME